MEQINHLNALLTEGKSLQDVIIQGFHPLIWCCTMYDEDLALEVIGKGVGVDVNKTDGHGFSALHYACQAGMEDVALALIEAKADIEAITEDVFVIANWDSGGRTPLHLAAEGGREDIIQLLLTQNADPNAVDFDGSSPFLLACGHNRVQCAQLLSKVTASVEYDHLLCVGAASDGDGGRVDNGDSDLRVSGIAKATVAVHGTASPHVIHTAKGGNGGDCGDAAETPDGRNSHSNNTAVDTAAVSTKSDWSKTSADAGRESRDDDARHRSEGTSACTLPTPEWSRAWMTHCRRKAQARAAVRFHPTGVMDAVHTVDAVFSVQECKEILSHLHAKTKEVGWKSDRHRAYNTTDIPSWRVDSIDASVRRKLAHRLFPAIEKLYGIHTRRLSYKDLFYVKYSATVGAQSGLDLHRDGSLISFNVLLNHHSAFEGGGTYIKKWDKVYCIQQGQCFTHSGQVLHAGRAVTKGERFILVGFLLVKTEKLNCCSK